MTSTQIVSIPVGVAVERRQAHSSWVDAVWRPVAIFTGVPAASAWTVIDSGDDATTFYAGQAAINLYRTETANYLRNLASGSPLLWVILRPTAGEPPFELLAVTADPAEGEALTGAGNDLVETLPMAPAIGAAIQAFIAEHHVDEPMFKRQRDRTGLSKNPE
ncbi:MAG TPA: DUF3305 domain-containing protein [Steroidobacteraceae bacterium]|jgi:hypothetical protein|nr:DUF3305 domain-containing protein [Steroidobacteraceae bacterium]